MFVRSNIAAGRPPDNVGQEGLETLMKGEPRAMKALIAGRTLAHD